MSFCKIVEQKMRMIRIKLASRQAALLAGILALPSAMMGQVSYEYTLPLNGSSSDSIDSGGEEDVYRITVTGSGTLTVHSSGSTDVYGYLLSSSGSELASNDDGGQGRNFQISHSVSAETYYVRVRHYDSTETGDYTVHSSFTASSSSGRGSSGGGSGGSGSGSGSGSDSGGSSSGSGSGSSSVSYEATLSTGSSRSGSISPAGDQDVYRITISRTGTLTLYSTGSTDTYGELLSSTGSVLTSDNNGGQSSNFRFAYRVTAGTYYVRVRHNNQTTGTGSYTVRNTFGYAPSLTSYEYNLSPNGGSSSASINWAGDEDLFRIVVTGSGTLTLYSTGSTDTYGELLSSSGSVLTSDNNSGQTNNFRLSRSVNSGTYYLRVRHNNRLTGTGSFAVRSSFTASSSGSGSGSSVAYELTLSASGSRSGSISPAGDQDVYRIIISRTGTLTLYSTGSTDTYGELLSSSGSVLTSDNNSGQSNNFRLARRVTAGTYYLRVRHNNRTTGRGSYTVRVLFGYAPSLSAAEYTLSPTSGSRSASINWAGDEDLFRIAVTGSGTLTLYSTGSTDTYGELLSSSGSVLTSDNNSGQSNNFRIARRVTAGTYYLRVRHNNRLTGTGSFSVRSSFSTSATVTQNDLGTGGDAATLSSVGSGATLVSSSVSGSGKIGTFQDTYDMYRFIVSGTNQVAAATIENLGNIGLELKLYNASGTELKSVTANANDRNAKHVFGWQSSGSNYYYLRVRALTSALSLQNYRLQIRTTAVDNMPPVTWGPILGTPVFTNPTNPPPTTGDASPPSSGWYISPAPPKPFVPDVTIPGATGPGRTLTVTEGEVTYQKIDPDPTVEDDEYYVITDSSFESSAIESYGDSNLGSETEVSTDRWNFKLSSTGEIAGTLSFDFIEIKYVHNLATGNGTLTITVLDTVPIVIPVTISTDQEGSLGSPWIGRTFPVWVIPVTVQFRADLSYECGISSGGDIDRPINNSAFGASAEVSAGFGARALVGLDIAILKRWGEWYAGVEGDLDVVDVNAAAELWSYSPGVPNGSIIFGFLDANLSLVAQAGGLPIPKYKKILWDPLPAQAWTNRLIGPHPPVPTDDDDE